MRGATFEKFRAAVERGDPTIDYRRFARIPDGELFYGKQLFDAIKAQATRLSREAAATSLALQCVAAGIAVEPLLEDQLERVERDRDTRDGNCRVGIGMVGVDAAGPAAFKSDAQNAVLFVQRRGVCEEISGFCGQVIHRFGALVNVLGLSFLPISILRLRLVGLLRRLSHGFVSVGGVAPANEDRLPAGLQGSRQGEKGPRQGEQGPRQGANDPAGNRPQVRR